MSIARVHYRESNLVAKRHSEKKSHDPKNICKTVGKPGKFGQNELVW
jgi:hypothetical protein